VANRIEAVIAKRQIRAIGQGNPTSAWVTILGRSFGRDAKARQWKIHEHNIATTSLGHV
jgi:hypothetical protein